MKQVIVIAACVLLGLAIYALLTGPVQQAITNLLTRIVNDIASINP